MPWVRSHYRRSTRSSGRYYGLNTWMIVGIVLAVFLLIYLVTR